MPHFLLTGLGARLGKAGVLLASLVNPPLTLAQEQSPLNWMPFGECNAAHWSSNRNLDDRQDTVAASCHFSVKPKLTPEVALGLNVRAGWQDNLGADSASHRVREAYIDWASDAWSLRLGRQIISWGRADGINPTDRLAPKDFTLLSADDESQRQGIDAATLRYGATAAISVSLTAAQFSAHITPQGSLPANLAKPPEPSDVEWALKLDHSGQGLDWSVSLFDGYDRFTRYSLVLSNPKAPVFQGDFERAMSFGADFAFATGAFTWRGEFSHSVLRPGCATCAPYERRVSRAVLGGDLDFASTMNLNFQVFGNRHWDYQLPTTTAGSLQALQTGRNLLNREFAEFETGVTLRLSDHIFNDKLKWEIAAVFDTTGGSRAIRPRMTYTFNDHFKLNAGMDFLEGDSQTHFGSFGKNRLAYVLFGWVF
jgi:hypothetical protein